MRLQLGRRVLEVDDPGVFDAFAVRRAWDRARSNQAHELVALGASLLARLCPTIDGKPAGWPAEKLGETWEDHGDRVLRIMCSQGWRPAEITPLALQAIEALDRIMAPDDEVVGVVRDFYKARAGASASSSSS